GNSPNVWLDSSTTPWGDDRRAWFYGRVGEGVRVTSSGSHLSAPPCRVMHVHYHAQRPAQADGVSTKHAGTCSKRTAHRRARPQACIQGRAAHKPTKAPQAATCRD